MCRSLLASKGALPLSEWRLRRNGLGVFWEGRRENKREEEWNTVFACDIKENLKN